MGDLYTNSGLNARFYGFLNEQANNKKTYAFLNSSNSSHHSNEVHYIFVYFTQAELEAVFSKMFENPSTKIEIRPSYFWEYTVLVSYRTSRLQ